MSARPPRSPLFPYTTLFRSISRTREYAADNMGAQISGQPNSLASALARIENAAHQIENAPAEHNPATAHLFIIKDRKSTRLNSSHLGISYAVFCLKKKTNTH